MNLIPVSIGAVVLICMVIRSSFKTYKSNNIYKREISNIISTGGRYWSSTFYFASGYLIVLLSEDLISLVHIVILLPIFLAIAIFTELFALNDKKETDI